MCARIGSRKLSGTGLPIAPTDRRNRPDDGIRSGERIMDSSPAPQSDDEDYRERYYALRQENQYLRQRLVEIESDMIEPQAAANNIEGVDQLKKENEQLQNRLAAMASAHHRVPTNEWAARLDELDRERAALVMENEWLKRELDKMKAKNPADTTVAVQSFSVPEVLRKMHEGLAWNDPAILPPHRVSMIEFFPHDPPMPRHSRPGAVSFASR